MVDDIATMFYGIRFVLAIILTVVICIILAKKKRKIVLSVIFPLIIWFVTYIILTYLPVENLFLGFDTPEAAFHYGSNMEILTVAEYDDYAMIVSKTSEGDSILFYILNKKDGRWKINVYAPKRDYTILKSNDKSKFLSITKMYIPNTNDCFIICNRTYFKGGEVESVSDNRNTEFKYYDVPIEGVVDFYYGVVKDIDSDYECYVDGETVKFD